MCPYLVRYGGLSIPSYPFLYGLGLASAGLVFASLLRRRGYGLSRSANMFMLAGLSVVVGGQILYGIARWPDVKYDLWGFLDFSVGGQILYGSLILTVPVLWLLSRLFRMTPNQVFDAAAVVTPLGLAIGRIGCLCKGCCHGTVTSLPWRVSYPKVINIEGEVIGTPAYMLHLRDGLIPFTAGRSLHVHPVQIYEALGMLVVFAVLLHLWRRGKLRGRLAPLFTLIYCLLRFNIEFIRVQEPILLGLTLAQVLSVALGSAAITWLILGTRSNQGKSTMRGISEISTRAGHGC